MDSAAALGPNCTATSGRPAAMSIQGSEPLLAGGRSDVESGRGGFRYTKDMGKYVGVTEDDTIACPLGFKQCRISDVSGSTARVVYTKQAGKGYDDMSLREEKSAADVPLNSMMELVYPDQGKSYNGMEAQARWELFSHITKATDGLEVGGIDYKKAIDVAHKKGLSTTVAAERKARHGPNALDEKKVNKWMELLKQFTGPMPIM